MYDELTHNQTKVIRKATQTKGVGVSDKDHTLEIRVWGYVDKSIREEIIWELQNNDFTILDIEVCRKVGIENLDKSEYIVTKIEVEY